MKKFSFRKLPCAMLLGLSFIVPAAFAQQTSDDEHTRAAGWVDALKLNDAAKSARVTEVITAHLTVVRDWHNEHPATNVPAGINPITGKKLNDVDRQVIADSAMPKSVHTNLLAGLRKDLNEEQVAVILDKYTIGKVAFTMGGYRGIVTNMTSDEEKFILDQLKLAREEAVDYKNMKEISVIFKIHKTQIEQHLNDNGRDWKKLFKDYVAAIKAGKAAPTGTNSAAVEQ
jgi:hypothetical protein